MDRLFRIDWYPQDWLIDTARLSPADRGIYIQLICLIYANRGPIENDPKWIAGVSGCSVRFVKTAIDSLSKAGFIQFSGSKITQKRAENELKTKREHLDNSSKGGRKRAEKLIREKENKDLNSSGNKKSLASPTAIAKATAKAKEKRPPESYWFARCIIEVDKEDWDKWLEMFPNISDDQLNRILVDRAIWYEQNPHEQSSNWFIRTQKYLANINRKMER